MIQSRPKLKPPQLAINASFRSIKKWPLIYILISISMLVSQNLKWRLIPHLSQIGALKLGTKNIFYLNSTQLLKATYRIEFPKEFNKAFWPNFKKDVRGIVIDHKSTVDYLSWKMLFFLFFFNKSLVLLIAVINFKVELHRLTPWLRSWRKFHDFFSFGLCFRMFLILVIF